MFSVQFARSAKAGLREDACDDADGDADNDGEDD